MIPHLRRGMVGVQQHLILLTAGRRQALRGGCVGEPPPLRLLLLSRVSGLLCMPLLRGGEGMESKGPKEVMGLPCVRE